MRDAIDITVELARRLPATAVHSLRTALDDSVHGLQRARAQAASAEMRTACDRLTDLIARGTDSRLLAGALAAAERAERDRRRSTTEIVWTGPDSGLSGARLTLAAVTDLIASAERELLMVSYAAHSDPHLTAALEEAAARGVEITLLLERHQDNPAFRSWSVPFRSIDATRLIWPADNRPQGAALHAKVLVVDDHTALIGSANLTSNAMERNLECGVLIRDDDTALTIRAHVARLYEQGALQRLPDD